MAAPMQRSFAGGEIAPALYGRGDQVKYATGLKTCRNFQIDANGAASNRQGFQLVAQAGGGSQTSRMLPFVFNKDQAYIVEVIEGQIRFYRQGARLINITFPAWSAGTNYVVADMALGGDGHLYYCILAHINHAPPNATYWFREPETSVDFPYAIPAPWLTAELPALEFDQSGDVMTIDHENHPPMELKRFGELHWTLTPVTTAPSIAAPSGLDADPGTGGGLAYSYVVTAVAEETYEESIASAPDTAACAAPTAAAPNALSWTAVAGAVEYNVYADQAGNGTFGFIGVAATNVFNDTGFVPDLATTPPIARVLFASDGNYPRTSTYFHQRHIYASTINAPETGWATRSGAYKNFAISSPIQDDDAITFNVNGKQRNQIRHMLESGKLVVMTSGGVFTIEGDVSGILRPTAINPKQQGYRPVSAVAPVAVDNMILYLQDGERILRDLSYDIRIDGYTGNDLTVFASHLTKQYGITRMASALVPNSIIWCVRADGALMGVTYVKEQQVVAWHRHDTDGIFEDVCVIPEDGVDVVYALVQRPQLNPGAYMRTVERLTPRLILDQLTDSRFLDSWSEYNGTNGTSTQLSLMGSGWTIDDTLTLLAFFGTPFVPGDVDNVFELRLGATKRRVKVTAYTSSASISVVPEKNIPPELRGVATIDWTRCVDQITLPLDTFALTGALLQGRTVAIYADGFVLPSVVVPVNGVIALPRCYGIIAVGIPIAAELELLDIDNPQSDIRGRQKHVTSAQLLVEDSRALLVGTDPDNLMEWKPDEPDDYGDVPPLATDILDLGVIANWEPGGRIIVRQNDPLPVTLLAVITNLDIGG